MRNTGWKSSDIFSGRYVTQGPLRRLQASSYCAGKAAHVGCLPCQTWHAADFGLLRVKQRRLVSSTGISYGCPALLPSHCGPNCSTHQSMQTRISHCFKTNSSKREIEAFRADSKPCTQRSILSRQAATAEMKNKLWHASFTYRLRNRFMSSHAALEGAIICDDKGWSKQTKADCHALVLSSCVWAITLQSLHPAWGTLLTTNHQQAETASGAYGEFPLLANPGCTTPSSPPQDPRHGCAEPRVLATGSSHTGQCWL